MNKIFEKRILTGKVYLILTGVFLTISPLCAQITEYAKIWDASKSSAIAKEVDPDLLFQKIVGQLNLKESKQGVNLRTLICGESRIPEVRLASLPEQKSWFGSSSERAKQLRQFLTKAKADIDYLASQPADQSQTNLYRALVHLIKQFDPQATEKHIVIFSDGAEVSSVFNANQYYQRPADLITDYDEIIKAFKRDSPLPDLTGVKVVLVTPGDTDMLLWLSRFWVKFITTQGGSATVRAAY